MRELTAFTWMVMGTSLWLWGAVHDVGPVIQIGAFLFGWNLGKLFVLVTRK